MRIITDPESWTGLRSERAVADDLAPRTEPHQPAGPGTAASLAAFVRGVLRLFGRR